MRLAVSTRTRPTPESTTCSGRCATRGRRSTSLYVASSKPLVFVRQVLDHFDLSGHFDDVFGSELDGTRTDKTELLAYALEQTGRRREQAIMIGDRSNDAIGARNNAMAFLGVLYGYGSVEELQGAGATEWVEEPLDLLSVLLDPSRLEPGEGGLETRQ